MWAGDESIVASIRLRRRILLVEGCRSPELAKPWRHARLVEAFCSRHGLKVESFSYKSPPKSISVLQTCMSPFASPLLGPRSPGLYNSEPGHQSFKHNDSMPALSLDSSFMKGSHSPPWSPPLGPLQLAPPVMALQEKLHGSSQVGVVQLSLHSDANGMILRWILSLPSLTLHALLSVCIKNMHFPCFSAASEAFSSYISCRNLRYL